MDSLITALVVLVVAAISTWLQKKNQEKQERENPRPPTPARPVGAPRPLNPRPVAPRPTSWEDELRKLLGEESAAPPPPRPAPPVRPTPVIIQAPRPAPTPRPIKVVPPPVVSQPTPAPQPATTLATLTGAAQVEQSVRDLGAMQESKRAYERASQLDTVMANRIATTPGKPVETTSVMHRVATPEVAQVLSLFKNARSARQAVLASIILGPPKALEGKSGVIV